jgi:hypothetical protein
MHHSLRMERSERKHRMLQNMMLAELSSSGMGRRRSVVGAVWKFRYVNELGEIRSYRLPVWTRGKGGVICKDMKGSYLYFLHEFY